MFTRENPLRVVLFFSGGATAFLNLQQHDPDWNVRYVPIAAFCNKADATGLQFCTESAIPYFVLNYKAFCNRYQLHSTRLDSRAQYFETIRDMIGTLPFHIILCSGFMLIMPEFFVKTFPGINVHPTDLSIMDTETNMPKYAGDGTQALGKVITDRNETNRATAHWMDARMDTGEIICFSPEIEVFPTDTPQTLQQRTKDYGDWTAFQKALKRIIDGTISIPTKKI